MEPLDRQAFALRFVPLVHAPKDASTAPRPTSALYECVKYTVYGSGSGSLLLEPAASRQELSANRTNFPARLGQHRTMAAN